MRAQTDIENAQVGGSRPSFARLAHRGRSPLASAVSCFRFSEPLRGRRRRLVKDFERHGNIVVKGFARRQVVYLLPIAERLRTAKSAPSGTSLAQDAEAATTSVAETEQRTRCVPVGKSDVA